MFLIYLSWQIKINSFLLGDCILLVGSVNDAVKNLGLMFDKHLQMEDHINIICKSLFYHLQNTCYLKLFSSPVALKTTVHAFITSRLDHFSSLLYGLADNTISKLQCILRCATKIVSNTKKHITPVVQK